MSEIAPEVDFVMTDPETDPPFLAAIRWNADGLVAAIVRAVDSGEVLMLAWMDQAAVRRTWATRQTHFYSRSRQAAWHKGGTSGHVQHVTAVRIDCDGDVLLIDARQVGGACHEGYFSCFSRRVDADGRLVRDAEPVFAPDQVYGGSTPRSIPADRG